MALRAPDRIAKRLLKAGKRPMDSSRSAQAASILDMPVQRAGSDALASHTQVLLVTYKRDRSGVPTPVRPSCERARVDESMPQASVVGRDPRSCSPHAAHRDLARLIAPAGAYSPTAERGEPPQDPIAMGPRPPAFELLSRPLRRAQISSCSHPGSDS